MRAAALRSAPEAASPGVRSIPSSLAVHLLPKPNNRASNLSVSLRPHGPLPRWAVSTDLFRPSQVSDPAAHRPRGHRGAGGRWSCHCRRTCTGNCRPREIYVHRDGQPWIPSGASRVPVRIPHRRSLTIWLDVAFQLSAHCSPTWSSSLPISAWKRAD